TNSAARARLGRSVTKRASPRVKDAERAAGGRVEQSQPGAQRPRGRAGVASPHQSRWPREMCLCRFHESLRWHREGRQAKSSETPAILIWIDSLQPSSVAPCVTVYGEKCQESGAYRAKFGRSRA